MLSLDPIWHARALRMVDIRAAEGDDDRQCQLQRGYDYRWRRTKWFCRHACLAPATQEPEAQPRSPAPECPYQAATYKHVQVVNVGRTLPGGSVRLAREVPYASETWKQRYGRRNLSESRNGTMEHMGLKRLPSFGLTHGRKENAIADFLDNLHTLGRLVQEATTLAFRRAVA